MKTFHWEEIEKGNGLTELRCFHTQRNTNFNTTRRIMSAFFTESEDLEAAKESFEQNRRCVVEGGAWEPIEGAKWYFAGNRWTIDKSQIRAMA